MKKIHLDVWAGIPEKWDPGPSGGTLQWDPKLGPLGGGLVETLGWDANETVKPNGPVLSMKINCLNLTSINGAILNLNKRKSKKELERPCANMLQCSNDEITSCFW